jgi:hypothetical protein
LQKTNNPIRRIAILGRNAFASALDVGSVNVTLEAIYALQSSWHACQRCRFDTTAVLIVDSIHECRKNLPPSERDHAVDVNGIFAVSGRKTHSDLRCEITILKTTA